MAQELGNTIGPTLELMFASLVWSVPLGIGMGTVAGVAGGAGCWTVLVMAVSVAGVSVPVFFLGLLLIWFVGFPLAAVAVHRARWTDLDAGRACAHSRCRLSPWAVSSSGRWRRMTRTAVLDVFGADHVRTARAKGLTEFVVVIRHALRNALIPVVTLIGLQIGFLLGGAVVTETIFSWPGVGRLAVGAILSSDFPMAQGTILVLAGGFIVINLVVDLLYVVLDPRVRA